MLEATMQFQPMGGTWGALGVMALALAASGWWYFRSRKHQAKLGVSGRMKARAGMLLFRGLAWAGFGWMLLGPTELAPAPREGAGTVGTKRPRVTMWVDGSASMKTRDVRGEGEMEAGQGSAEASRWEALSRQWLNADFLTKLEALAQVDWRWVGGTPMHWKPGEEPAWTGHTRLWDSITQAQAQEASQEMQEMSGDGWVVVLSDGHDTEGGSLDECVLALRRGGRRTVAVPVGQAETESTPGQNGDWVSCRLLADRLQAGQKTALRITLRRARGRTPAATGAGAGEAAWVVVKEEGRVLEERKVEWGDDQELRWDVPVQPELRGQRGMRMVEYAVEWQAARDTPGRTIRTWAQVLPGPARVLLLEGEPGWSMKWLAQTLRSHAGMEVTAAYGWGKVQAQRWVVGAGEVGELSAGNLAKFDVVLLGKGVEKLWQRPEEAAAALRDYGAEQGGILAAVRGQPVEDASLREALADLWPGAHDPTLPQTLQLAGHWRPATRGKTAWVEGGIAWRDLFAQGPGGNAAQGWLRLVQWLAFNELVGPGAEVGVEMDRHLLKVGEEAQLLIRARARQGLGTPLQIKWKSRDGREGELPPALMNAGIPGRPGDSGEARATWRAAQAGVYEVMVVMGKEAQPVARTMAVVEEDDRETREAGARPGDLERWARESGGVTLDWKNPQSLLKMMEEQQGTTARTSAAPMIVRPRFDHPLAVLLIFVGCLGEWMLRRRGGLA